jgi:hypothetical protein
MASKPKAVVQYQEERGGEGHQHDIGTKEIMDADKQGKDTKEREGHKEGVKRGRGEKEGGRGTVTMLQ